MLQVDQRLDGHEILVYTNRGPFIEGISIDVSVLVERYPAGQLVPAATVTIQTNDQGGGAVQTFRATHAATVNKAYYAAGLHLPAGHWQIAAAVKDGSWAGVVSFPLTVVAAKGATTKSVAVTRKTVMWSASGLVIAWAIWFIVRAQRHVSGRSPGK